MKKFALSTVICSVIVLAGFTTSAQIQAQQPVQQAQAAKAKAKTWDGQKLVVTQTGLTVDGKNAAIVEKEASATVYQQGLLKFIVYKNGKIAVTDLNDSFKGYAK